MSNSIGSLSGLLNAAMPHFDPSKRMDSMVQRFLKKNDQDGDGKLSAQDLKGLSNDAMKALDTDGDGMLSADEIKSAIQNAMDKIKDAGKANGAAGAWQAIKDTPEGELMALMRPGRHHRPQAGTEEQPAQTSSSFSFQYTEVQISITHVSYTMSGTASQPQSGGSSLSVTA